MADNKDDKKGSNTVEVKDQKDKIIEMGKASGMALDEISKVIKEIDDGGVSAISAWETLTDKIKNSSAEAGASTKQQLEFEKQRLANLKFIVDEQVKSGDVLDSQAVAMQKDLKDQEQKLKIIQDQTDKLEKQEKITKSMLGIAGKVGSSMKTGAKNIAGSVGSVKSFASSVSSAGNSLYANVLAVIGKFDKATKDMQKSLGTSSMNKELLAARGAAYAAGAELDEFNNAVVTLNNEFTGFSQQSKQTRGEMAKTVALLDNLGFEASASAAAIQMSTRSLGETPEAAMKSIRGLRTFAREIGMAPKRLSGMLKSNIGALSNYGQNYMKTFKQLALATRNTGVEMEKLIGIAEKFTTFEGAADAAGNLNMILGGAFVDATELMEASLEGPDKALEVLKRGLQASGKSFNDFNAAQKRAIMDAGGFTDAAEAAAIFNNELDKGADSLSGQADKNKDLQKEGAKNIDLQKGINRMIEGMYALFAGDIIWALKQIKKLLVFLKDLFKGKNAVLGETGKTLAHIVVKFLMMAMIASRVMGPLKMIGGLLFSWPGILLAIAGAIGVAFFGVEDTLGGIKSAFKWISDAASDTMKWLGGSGKASKDKKGKKGAKGSAEKSGPDMDSMPPALKQKIDDVKKTFESFTTFIKDNWGKILLGGIGVLVVVGVALRAFNKAISPIKDTIRSLAVSFFMFGFAIALVVGSITLFLYIWDSLQSGFSGGMMVVIILGLLIGGFYLLIKAVDKMKVSKLAALGGALLSLAVVIGVMMVGLSLFFYVLQNVDGSTIAAGVGVIIAVLAALVGAAYLLGNPMALAGIGALSTFVVALGVSFLLLGIAVAIAYIGFAGILEAMNAADPDHIIKMAGAITLLALAGILMGIAGVVLLYGAIGIGVLVLALWALTSDSIVSGVERLGTVFEKIVNTIGNNIKGTIEAIDNLIKTLKSLTWDEVGKIGISMTRLGSSFKDFMDVFSKADKSWIPSFQFIITQIVNFPFNTVQTIVSSLDSLHQIFAKPISNTFIRSLAKVIDQLKRLNATDVKVLITAAGAKQAVDVVSDAVNNGSDNANMQTATRRTSAAKMQVTIIMPVNLNGRVFNDAISQAAEAQVINTIGNISSVNVTLGG